MASAAVDQHAETSWVGLAAGPHPRAVLGVPGSGGAPRRAEADLRGPGLELPVPGSRHPQPRRLPHQLCRRDAGGRGARRGRRDARVREPLRASRRADLPRGRRHGQGLHLRLSCLALRPARQPVLGRIPARRRTARAAWRTTFRMRRARPAQAARRRRIGGLVFGTLSADAPSCEITSGRRSPRASAACCTSRSRSSAASPSRCRTTGSSTSRT